MSHRKKPDYYTRLAHERSYPARSVFKLKEIDRKVRLFSRGDRVLDLGASPGSWTKYILERIGNEGRIVAIDTSPPSIALPANAQFVRIDLLTVPPEAVCAMTGEKDFDVVVSDLAPRTTGIKAADQENSWILFLRALELARLLLVPGGRFAGKLFFSPRHHDGRTFMKNLFTRVRTLQTRATPRGSSEVFLIGLGYKRQLPPCCF